LEDAIKNPPSDVLFSIAEQRTKVKAEQRSAGKTKNPKPQGFGFLAERWGFEPQNAFDTLHDFQSCALDQLSHLSIFGCTPQRHTIIPERYAFVKHFFKKMKNEKIKQKIRNRKVSDFWRKDGDSNPRTLLTRYTISSRAP
jgi:hypothetical protein